MPFQLKPVYRAGKFANRNLADVKSLFHGASSAPEFVISIILFNLSMLKKLLSLALVGLLLSTTISLPALSQSGQSRQKAEKGEKELQQPPATTQKTKAVNESCDGALNIVPTKSMTFVRKRRPANGGAQREPAPAKEQDAKPVERRPGDGR
jgi:hypothetical protein